MVEFALVLPLFLLLILGMLDFGKAFNYWIDGTHLSHEGARFAAVGKNPGPGSTLAASIKERADTNELKNGGGSVSNPGVSGCIDFPNATTPKVGEPVEVRVTFTYNFLNYVTSMVPSVTSKTVINKSTMRIERVTPDLYEQCV
jgi:Flp pilus assembly protein TadG